MPPTPYHHARASNAKFEELLRDGGNPLSFQQGDVFVHPTGVRFCIEYDTSGRAVEHRREAGLEARGLLAPNGAPLTYNNSRNGPVRVFANGPAQFSEVASLLAPRRVHPEGERWWQHWSVERNGVDLGTMEAIRERWHDAKVATVAAAATAAAPAVVNAS